MNPLDWIALARAADSKQPLLQTLSDLDVLYTAETAIKGAGGLGSAAGTMAKAGTLKPAVAALKRTSALLDALLEDPTEAPRVAAVLGALS